MKPAEQRIDRLLDAVAARQGQEPTQPIVGAARQRLVVSLQRTPRRGARRSAAFAALAVACLAAGVILWLARGVGRPLRFEVGGATVSVGDWLAAPTDRNLPVRFSNGASVLLRPGARGRVSAVRASGATVEVEHGGMAIVVPHAPGTDWTFLAGPFAVQVIGTRFDLAWDATTGVFEMEVMDGNVQVRGPLAGSRQHVVGGQSVRLTAANASAQPRAIVATAPELPAALESASAPTLPNSAPIPTTMRAEATDWRGLAKAAHYREAIALAEAAGFDNVVAGSDAADLLLLGDASRYAGNVTRARQCYAALRRSFGGSAQAALALFRLGVLDFPSPNAVASFEQFLRERPGDALAPEALGRILEVQQRSGNTAAARATAERYLSQYPKGAHATLAHSVLGQ